MFLKNFTKQIYSMHLLKLPAPASISFNWNFGSLLGLNLFFQILTGLFMTMYYDPELSEAFNSVSYLTLDVSFGWVIRSMHANGATSFFFFIYFHMGRGLYYKSYLKSFLTWMSGLTLYLLFMGVAFLGYVLPWGQMSFWGATVITNLISAIPYFGSSLVEWIWGGFSVSNPTLTRFFTLHYSMPIISMSLIFSHLIFLHETGSSNPLGLGKNSDKIFFHPFFTLKDVLGFILFSFILFFFSMKLPNFFLDTDNFILANPLVTPVHIQPEWYFLFAYAILRSVPSKLGGVVSLLMSIFILYFLPFFNKEKSSSNYKLMCLMQFIVFLMLTFIGAMPVEYPFFNIGFYFSILYFSIFSLFIIVV